MTQKNLKEQRLKEISKIIKVDLDFFISKKGKNKLLTESGFSKKIAKNYQIGGYDFNPSKEEITEIYLKYLKDNNIEVFDFINDIDENNKILGKLGLKIGDLIAEKYKKNGEVKIDGHYKIGKIKKSSSGSMILTLEDFNGDFKEINLTNLKSNGKQFFGSSVLGYYDEKKVDLNELYNSYENLDNIENSSYFFEKSNGREIFNLTKNDFIEYNYLNGRKSKILFLNNEESDKELYEYDYVTTPGYFFNDKGNKNSALLRLANNDVYFCGINEESILKLEYDKELFKIFNSNGYLNSINWIKNKNINDFKNLASNVNILAMPIKTNNIESNSVIYGYLEAISIGIFIKNKNIINIFNKEYFNNYRSNFRNDESINKLIYSDFEIISNNEIIGLNKEKGIKDIYKIDDSGNIIEIIKDKKIKLNLYRKDINGNNIKVDTSKRKHFRKTKKSI